MEALIHVANVLYLLSYSVRDILWLRVLTVIAACCLMPYFFFRSEPLMAAIYWNMLFTVVNGYQIYRLILERRPVKLAEDEHRLYQMVFRSLTPREFLSFVKLGTWERRDADAEIVHEGQPLDRMMVLFEGEAEVRHEGERIADLGAGSLIGEMSYLTDEPPGADVVIRTPSRLVTWPKLAVRNFLDGNRELRAAIQHIISKDLVGKLRAAS